MARIRSIKPEFWTSEQITECSPNARLLFIGIWTFADDNGVHPASVKRLKMEVFPSDDFTQADIAAMVAELVAAGLLRPYNVDGEGFWQVTGWHHQKIDQPTYKHPLPDGSLPRNVRRRLAEPDSTNKVQRTDAEQGSPNDQRPFDERSVRERRGEERKGEELSSSLRSEDSQSPASGALPPADPDSTVRQHPASEKLFTAVLETYHRRLPRCQHVSVLNPKRRKRILAADKLARQVCREQGWPYDPAGFWDAYFAECEGDAWMRGEVPNPRNPSWKQNLDVLLAEDRFAGIMDRAIDAMRREAAA